MKSHYSPSGNRMEGISLKGKLVAGDGEVVQTWLRAPTPRPCPRPEPDQVAVPVDGSFADGCAVCGCWHRDQKIKWGSAGDGRHGVSLAIVLMRSKLKACQLWRVLSLPCSTSVSAGSAI